MNAFHDLPWDERQRYLGDDAERAFRRWCELVGLKCAKYGLDRPEVDVSKLGPMLRYTPDFIAGSDLYEVMVVGRDNLLKLKVEKYMYLGQWNLTMAPTHLWVWHWPSNTGGAKPVPSLANVVIGEPDLRSFHDGKHYWAIDVDRLDIQWLDLTDPAEPRGSKGKPKRKRK